MTDLAGKKISASVGSAGHGTLVRALASAGINPTTGVDVLNQQPQVGASALESGQAQALSQFVAWPGLLVYQGKAKLLYDGAELNYPTLHGVVVRRAYAAAHPDVLDAFLQAQLDATDFLNSKPLEAARIVAESSGLPQEVVYLYNGPGGTAFDTTLKPSLVDALKNDVPYLKSIGDFANLDVANFVQDGPLRAAFATRKLDYDAALHADRAGAGQRTLAAGIRQHPARRHPGRTAEGRPRRHRPRIARAGRLRPRQRAGYPLVRRQVGVGARRRELSAVRHRRGRATLPRRTPGQYTHRLPTSIGRCGMTAVDVSIDGAAVAVPVAGIAKPRKPASAWRSRVLRLTSVLAAVGLWQLLTAGHVRFWLRFDTLPTVTDIVGALTRARRHPRVLA